MHASVDFRCTHRCAGACTCATVHAPEVHTICGLVIGAVTYFPHESGYQASLDITFMSENGDSTLQDIQINSPHGVTNIEMNAKHLSI